MLEVENKYFSDPMSASFTPCDPPKVMHDMTVVYTYANAFALFLLPTQPAKSFSNGPQKLLKCDHHGCSSELGSFSALATKPVQSDGL